MRTGIPLTRRGALALGAAAALAAPPFRRLRAAETLFVNTWGGPWERAAAKHLFEPFTRDTGIEIRPVSPVSFAKLAAQVRSGAYEFDVTTLGLAELVRAQQARLLDGLEGLSLHDGATFQNGVASHAFATVLAWRALVWAFRLVIHRLTLRLAFSYFLIGIVPIPLLAALLAAVGFLLAHEFIATRLRNEVDTLAEVERVSGTSIPRIRLGPDDRVVTSDVDWLKKGDVASWAGRLSEPRPVVGGGQVWIAVRPEAPEGTVELLPIGDRSAPFLQRLADRIAEFGGSWTFILIFCALLLAWVALNSFILAKRSEAFDPYPYILLNLFLSMLAALQAPIIMMSQNRQAQKDRLAAAHDYEVNLKAELEIRHLHEKLDELREQKWAELIAIQQEQIQLLTRLLDEALAVGRTSERRTDQ